MDDPTPTEKVCTKCGEVKPLDQFHRRPSAPDGRHPSCAACKRAYLKRYRIENADRIAVDRKDYAEANADYIRERDKRYRDANRDRVRETARRGYARNRVRRRAARKAYVAANREAVIASQDRWRVANPEKHALYVKRWRAKNPLVAAEIAARRRARIAGTKTGPVDIEGLWTGRCGICDLLLTRQHPWPHRLSPSLDHIVPLAKGGGHIQDNLQWAHLRCNLSKRDNFQF